MATVQHLFFFCADLDRFAPTDGMPSLGSPCEAIPNRRNPNSQDPDACIHPRRNFARGPTPRDLDNLLPMCLSPAEHWSSSPWACRNLDDSTQATSGCEGFDGDLMTMDMDSESVTTRPIKPSFNFSATHTAKSSRLGLGSYPHWQCDDIKFSRLFGFSTDYRPEFNYSKPAAPLSRSECGERNSPYSAPKTPEANHSHNSLSWNDLETSPFPPPSSGSNFSERSRAISRTQKSSRALHAMVNISSCGSYRSATNTPSRIDEDIFEASIHWQPRISPGPDTYLDSQPKLGASSKSIESPSSRELPRTSVVIKAAERNDCYRPLDTTSVPTLSASLHEFSLTPPPPCSNGLPSLKPLQQCPRFPGDLYTPTFIRKEGKAREGWCGLCRPGRWLVLKNSAFWYDKSFVHGISATSGQAWDGPSQTRFGRKAEVWEGLCGTCGQWIILTASKSGGVSWFRHAYKCHAHVKTKKTLKRPSESEVAGDSKAKTMNRMRKDEDTVRVAGI